MIKGAYYNEIDPYAAQWLRNLIVAGEIADGDVDERSIEDVTPSELRGYTQCHFFAGIGIWSLALRQSGWSDNRPIWTGSCPCQPFSTAGKSAGFDDERHLWPHWFHLIEECAPDVIMGEQVASKDGLTWLDLVSSDLEGSGNTFWATDTCAAGFGAPQIRQRLYWVADADIGERQGWSDAKSGDIANGENPRWSQGDGVIEPYLTISKLGDTDSKGIWGQSPGCNRPKNQAGDWIQGDTVGSPSRLPAAAPTVGPTNGFWRDADWLFGRDGYFRPVEPGTFPLAHGDPTRVGKIGAYGNAICAAQARGFIESIM